MQDTNKERTIPDTFPNMQLYHLFHWLLKTVCGGAVDVVCVWAVYVGVWCICVWGCMCVW